MSASGHLPVLVFVGFGLGLGPQIRANVLIFRRFAPPSFLRSRSLIKVWGRWVLGLG